MGEKPSHHTQGFATARNSRPHRSDRQVYNRSGFLVSHPLQPDEQDYRPLLLGQLGESALQIAKLEPHRLSRGERRARITFLQFDAGPLARVSASQAEVLVVQYRE